MEPTDESKRVIARIIELREQGNTWPKIAEILASEGYRNEHGEGFSQGAAASRYKRAKKKLTSDMSETSDTRNTADVQSDRSEMSEASSETVMPSEESERSDAPSPLPDISELSDTNKESSDLSDRSDGRTVLSDTSDLSDTSKRPSELSDTSESSEPTETLSDRSELSDSRPLVKSEMSDRSENMPLPEHWKRQIVQIVQTQLRSIMEEQKLQTVQISGDELPPVPEKIKGEEGRKVSPGERVKIAGTVDKSLEERFQAWRKQKGLSLSKALDAALWHFLGKPALSFETSDSSDHKTRD